jgi:SSS family solute:Na+ symporter
LMSTIAAALNSSATLVAVDIVKRLKPETSDQTQVRIGRYSAVGIMLLAMVWSTQGGRYSSIFEAINAIASNIAPPITTVFLWGVFWRRGTKEAAISTLFFGFLLGAAAFILDLPVFGSEKIITHRWGIPFMMQAWWGFCITSVFYVIVSLCTPKPSPEQIEGLTWKNPLAILTQDRLNSAKDPRVIAGVLLLVTIVLYIILG